MERTARSTETQPLSQEDVKKLLAVRGNEGLYYCIALYTGLRVSEVLDLRWGDFYDEKYKNVKESIAVKPGKQAHYRHIPIHAELKARLQKERKWRTRTHKVVSSKVQDLHNYGGITARAINMRIQRTFEKLGIKTKNPSSHCLRKTWARNFYEQFGLAMTMQAMGHKNAGTTLRYIGITGEVLEDSYKRFSYSDTLLKRYERGHLKLDQILDLCRHVGDFSSLRTYLESQGGTPVEIDQIIKKVVNGNVSY